MTSELPTDIKDRIVVFGSIVQDLVSYTDRFPNPGESVRGNDFKSGSGGKGANQAVAAARLGAKVSMIGMVGNDMFGEMNVKSLKDNGVDTSCIGKTDKTHTATATITVNREGENSIVVTLGANLEMTPEIADANEELIASAKMIMCQGEINEKANRRAFEIARKHGVTTFFNPAPGDPNMDKSILELVDIICTNENETEFITGAKITGPKVSEFNRLDAGSLMTRMGPTTAILTIGAKGAVVVNHEKQFATTGKRVTTKRVNAVDTTGAGDCFCGSFAANFISGHDVYISAGSATAIAALSVTRHGTQSSYWTLDEIKERNPHCLAENFDGNSSPQLNY